MNIHNYGYIYRIAGNFQRNLILKILKRQFRISKLKMATEIFQRIKLSEDEQIESVLSKVNGALSQLMPSSMMTITIMFTRGCHS